MKKSLFAIGLTLSMALTLSVPAFAVDNVNADGTAVTLPGAPGGNHDQRQDDQQRLANRQRR